ncbi:MAG: ABC transporter permease, partial [Sphingobacterium sp.]
GGVIKYEDKLLKVNDIILADSSFFSIFSHHFIAGNPSNALSQPQSIVLTEKMATQLFGSANLAINKTIYFDNNPHQVTGIIENVPENSHFSFSAIRSFSEGFAPDWSNFYLYTYVLLKNAQDGPLLQSKMPEFVKKHLTNQGFDVEFTLELQPLTDIRLHSNLSFELGTNRSVKFIYIFTSIGFLILAIAIINYINISTAKASTRLQEVAVRKVIGSTRKDLIKLFLVESGLITFLSALFSIILAYLFIPLLHQLSGKELQLWDFGIVKTLLILIPFTLIMGLIGGLYPALFFSSFKTVPALKNQMGKQHFQALFRKSLVIFQFIVAIIMICATVVIYRQLSFMQKKDLGFDKNQVITFHLDNENARLKGQNLRTEILKNPAIQEVAFAGNPIGNNNIGIGMYNVENNGIIDPNNT